MADYALNPGSRSVRELRKQLRESLKLRVLGIPVPPKLEKQSDVRLAILFSGGLDCTVLARITHDILSLAFEIDLLNVAFENLRILKSASSSKTGTKNFATVSIDPEQPPSASQSDRVEKISSFETCPDRCTGRKAFQELQEICPRRIWRFVIVSYSPVAYSSKIAENFRSMLRMKRQ